MSHTAIFRRLHTNTTPFRLPNAWDAASACLFESLGATAIATTSAGVAWALGYRDGRLLPADELLAAAKRIGQTLKLPLSIDVENGYSDDPKAVADLVKRLVDLGVAGINIEDGTDTPALLASKIEVIRNALSQANADLFINARCDVFLASLGEESMRVRESIARGKIYVGAGADGLFLPGIVQPQHIEAVVEAIAVPLNVMAWPGLVDAAELGKLGVRRLSAGSGISQAVWAKAAELAQEFLESGRSAPLFDASMPYPQLQELLSAK
jgi:2-methylisocitrate lyase-like PEP mutase family enzyme